MRRIAALIACLVLLAMSGCAPGLYRERPGGPGCYDSNGRSDLVAGAEFLAEATGGTAGSVFDADCQDYAGAMVPIYYPGLVTEDELRSSVRNLAYCWVVSVASSAQRTTPPTAHVFFCQVPGNRFRVTISSGEKIALEVYLTNVP